MGCGLNIKKGWVNIDLFQKDCLNLDLRENLPFSDGIAEEIYSEHLLEHLRFPEHAMTFLQESFRVLIPGGLFSLGVPDAQVLLKSYTNGCDVKEFRIRATLPENPTRMQLVNVMFKNFGHQYMYDQETLEKMLASVGFVNFSHRSFDPDRDSEHRRDWTLYVDTYKPN